MIAPDFRLTENMNMLPACANFVAYNYGKPKSPLLTHKSGDNMWKSLETDMASVQQLHNNLVPAASHKSDSN
jgi:hypothetical protein